MLKNDLPGWEAQRELSPGYNPKYRQPKPGFKEASVVAIISPVDGQLNLTFIKRASHYKDDKHKGQISFPGGKIEEGESRIEAAYREVEEEIGVPKTEIEIIGELTSLYVFVSDFMIYPFLAISKKAMEFTPDPLEVDGIINWPLEKLLQGTSTKDISIRNSTIKNVPYYPLGEEVLWGATSMVTAEILALLKRANH